MTLEDLRNSLPEYARDIKLNLASLAADESLSQEQLWGCFLACALAARNPALSAAVAQEAANHLSPEAVQAAKAAAAVMAMNNVYYRFVHLSSNTTYQTMPARLRMNIIANPGVDKISFELWSLAVSAINGCGACIDSHEQHVLNAGLSAAQIQTAVRIAATLHAAAAVLDGESALQGAESLSAAA